MPFFHKTIQKEHNNQDTITIKTWINAWGFGIFIELNNKTAIYKSLSELLLKCICQNWQIYLYKMRFGICGAAGNANPRMGAAQNQLIQYSSNNRTNQWKWFWKLNDSYRKIICHTFHIWKMFCLKWSHLKTSARGNWCVVKKFTQI